EQIEPFLATAGHCVDNARMVLFVHEMGPRFLNYAADHGIEILDSSAYLHSGLHPMNARFFMWRDYLTEHYAEVGSVLLTDVRDVFFQGNPFLVHRPKPVLFAAEDGTIGDCSWNREWIRDLFGESVLSSIADNVISCAGTTLGTALGVRAYL